MKSFNAGTKCTLNKPLFCPDNGETLIELANRILTITKDNDYLQNPRKQAKVNAFEMEIDQLVYQLYDLTLDEIKIVEGENENAD